MADLPRQLPPDVAAALARGNMIEAIKLLRGKYNVGLAEAKALLVALQKQAQAAAQGAAQGAAQQAPPKPAQHSKVGMQPGHHHPHTAETLHIDPNLSPGEVRGDSTGGIFAAVIVAVFFVLGVMFYF